MKPLDMFCAPLEGVNLIEASAGTGKTYTIESLCLRLILERGLNLAEILVVTYTRAATDELKNRIRSKLLYMSDALATGCAADPFIGEMLSRTHDIPDAREKIQNALVDFDKAAIHTIHGFCQRILTDHAFETHNLFDFDVIADPLEMIRDIARDFWRNHFYAAPMEIAAYAGARLGGPDHFTRLAANPGHRDMTIIPKLQRPVMDKPLGDLRFRFSVLRENWFESKNKILECLKDPSLNGNIYGGMKPDNNFPGMSKRDIRLRMFEKEMDRFFDNNYPSLPLFDKFIYFTKSKVISSTLKKQTPPDHPFFALCNEFLEKSGILETAMNELIIYLESDFILYAKKELDERKHTRNTVTFDDLLVMVRNALGGKYGPYLIEKIRRSYKAAMVDEFQDTDDIQYDIFSRIFAHPGCLFLMIGDPKQAIYDFRGADIFSYMKAAKKVQNTHTLLQNYRSSPLNFSSTSLELSSFSIPSKAMCSNKS